MFLVIYCICDKLNFWKILKNNKVRAIWKLTRKTNSTLEQISGHEFLLGQLVWYIRSYFPASFVTPSQTTEGQTAFHWSDPSATAHIFPPPIQLTSPNRIHVESNFKPIKIVTHCTILPLQVNTSSTSSTHLVESPNHQANIHRPHLDKSKYQANQY